MSYDDYLIDRRTVERYIAKGIVQADVLEASIANLPDAAHNADYWLSESSSDVQKGTTEPGSEQEAVTPAAADASDGSAGGAAE